MCTLDDFQNEKLFPNGEYTVWAEKINELNITANDFLDMTLRDLSDYLEDNGYDSAVMDGMNKYGNRMRLRVTLKPIGDDDL